MTTYGNEDNKGEEFWKAGLIAAMVLLFIALSQPLWRGEEMLAEYRANCDKVGGTMLETKKALGTSYECAERLDR